MILFFFLIYLFMAVLGLRFCARAFSSCGKRGPLFIAVRGPLTIAASFVAEHRLQTRRLSSCGSRALDAQAQQLWLTGLVAPRHVGSSQTRARTHVPCIGRQTLNRCATREALSLCDSWCYVCMLLVHLPSYDSQFVLIQVAVEMSPWSLWHHADLFSSVFNCSLKILFIVFPFTPTRI